MVVAVTVVVDAVAVVDVAVVMVVVEQVKSPVSEPAS
jgi:hypothetical protein